MLDVCLKVKNILVMIKVLDDMRVVVCLLSVVICIVLFVVLSFKCFNDVEVFDLFYFLEVFDLEFV